ncbi:tetratricopeptide repeat protein [Streptomyces fuscichromogenes]|uniref:Uncharacterized protein n=1 Tax=Streptomyces fuscichromogenes TaxID=1324013 RepID=A0A917XIL7_9ACTN|nr:tetratricopeptide repeat protein [Streptomyces fuscichromogenes]GGN29370.1 hypothetical protein GCM10011578_065920 [Streptomyces fuscichromogenes]
MSRLSREEKREVQQEGLLAPVDVRVAGATASVDGVPLFPGPGEEPQQAVLNHLQHLARGAGRPVLATIHDTRIGYVVPLQVNLDGSSSFTGDPVRLAAPPVEPREQPAPPTPPAPPVRSASPVLPAPPLPPAPGTVQPPTGAFGPPPVMTTPAPPETALAQVPARAPAPTRIPAPGPAKVPAPAPAEPPAPVTARVPVAVLALVPEETSADRDPDPRSTPTPARGFDAVAEEVLGDEPVALTAEGAALLTEPVARINEAVRTGRIEAAAELAERTVAEAAAVLGDGHTEVLHLGELTAYISYLAGDPERAFHLSLDLARQRRHARDGEAAYGNVRSAATAWRAVRDPEHGLRLGRELIDLWTQLTAEDGPAGDDIEELESAHARMDRLTERARRAAQNA